MRKLALFGSTGSIGTQSLDIIEGRFDVVALTCGNNINLFEKQIRKFSPKYAVTAIKNDDLQKKYPHIEFLHGDEGLKNLAKEMDYDILLNAVVGIAGLVPTYEAVLRGKKVALANKESLVAGGNLIMKSASDTGAEIIPVDSEHSAIFQCLQGNRDNSVKKIILTASGGPFRGYDRKKLQNVSVEQSLAHPNWEMGKKITIDSATLMNKGLEVIEAKWLFGSLTEKIDVYIHPGSIVHSMVEFDDNAVLAQLGTPDMRVPISYALSYPERWVNTSKPLGLPDMTELKFEKPDSETFKPLKLAFEALDRPSGYAVAMNAANELLVERFLSGRIGFLDIGDNIERVLNKNAFVEMTDIDEILELDRKVKGELDCTLSMQ